MLSRNLYDYIHPQTMWRFYDMKNGKMENLFSNCPYNNFHIDLQRFRFL